jgi:hypothetical protein
LRPLPKQPDDFPRRNTYGKILHHENYDFGGDFSGYVPGLRDHMYFFGSFNPSISSRYPAWCRGKCSEHG